MIAEPLLLWFTLNMVWMRGKAAQMAPIAAFWLQGS